MDRTIMKLKFKECVGLVITATVVLCFHWLSVAPEEIELTKDENLSESFTMKKPGMKYILQWTKPNTIPFVYWGHGQDEFIKKKCKVNKCYVTPDRSLLKSTEFDLVAFHGPEIAPRYGVKAKKTSPKIRSTNQKYTFVSIESAKNYPVCDGAYDGFFNWTFTYKFDSDVSYKYIAVKNINGDEIGPKQDMHWIKVDAMKPVNNEMKRRLQTKNKAVAWFVSNCKALSKREVFADQLRYELKKHNLILDIFGKCGKKKCPINKMDACLRMIEKDYYFYLAFENTFAVDYVTEKLLLALQHFAIPVVLGGANYTRFMPDGIYLNGRKLKPKALAKEMADIIKNKERYYSFFKWHNHYSYHARDESPDTDDLCKLCEMLHDEDLMKQTTVHADFRKWWNVPGSCRINARKKRG